MNFEKVYNEFILYSENRYKKQGFYNLVKDFNSKILPFFKDKNIEDITKLDFVNWQNIILKRNYKNSYNSRLYFAFNTFLKFCCTFYDLSSNVALEVGNFPKKVEEKKVDFYTYDEFNQFINGFDDNIYKEYFVLLFYTGVRPSEGMALRFSDLSNSYLHIRHNITRRCGRELISPKNQSSIRTIKIDNHLNKELLELKKYYINYYDDLDYDYFIFGGKKPLSPTSIERYKLRACEKSGIRPITIHQFRHSHATLLLQKGIMINEVSKRLGHSRVSTTLDIYTHTDLTQEKRVINTLNSLRNNFFHNLVKDFKRLFSILKH